MRSRQPPPQVNVYARLARAGGFFHGWVQNSARRTSGPGDGHYPRRFGHFQPHAIAIGGASGASAWDGYAATAIAGASLEALRTGLPNAVTLETKPGFYS